jgi:VWFA-related protein
MNKYIPALIAAMVCATGQQAAPPAAPDNVVYDIIVKDKKGKPVKDLTAAEVRVTDDGKEQKLKSLRLVDGAEAVVDGSRQGLDPIEQVRLVTLAIQGMGDSARRITRDAVKDLLKQDQSTNIYYSVVTIDQQLNVLQPFTKDKEAVRKAVDFAMSGKFAAFAAESQKIKPQLKQAAAGAGGLDKKLAEVMLEMLAFDSTVNEWQRMTVFGLLSLVRGQASMPGRKAILYFSEGIWLPTYLDEPFRNISSSASRANVAIYPIDARGVMTSSLNQGARSELQGATGAIAADTTAGDGRVSTGQLMAADRAEQAGRSNTQLPLLDLAAGTGTFLIGDSNDMKGPMRRVLDDVNTYYELIYDPGIDNYDGRLRKTKVEVSRKDVEVRAPGGYFALPASLKGPALSPSEFALMKVIEAPPAPSGVEFRAAALRLDSSASQASGMMVVEVPMSGVKFTEDVASKTFRSRISLLALVKDAKGEVAAKLAYDLPRNGPLALLPQARAGNFIYTQRFEVPPGKYTVVTALLDHEAGKSGVQRAEFDVPARPSGVGVSGLCLVRNYQPNVKGLDPQEPLQFQGGKITPTLGNQVYAVKGAQLSTFFIVHPDPAIKEKPTANIEFLVDGMSVAKADLPLPAPDARGWIPYVMSAPAEAMPAAAYEIHLTVKQGATQAEDRMKVIVAAPK